MDNQNSFNMQDSVVEKPKKSPSGKSIFVIAIAIVVIVAVFTTFGDFKGSFLSDDTDYTFKNVESIEVEVAAADVSIKSYNGNETNIKISGQEDFVNKLEVSCEKNGKLKIKQTSGKVNFSGTGNKIEINIPQKIYGDSKIVTASGDILTNGFSGSELTIRTASGDIVLKDTQAGELEILSTSGDVVASGNASKEAKFSTTSGDIIVKDYTGDEIKVSSVSGEIKVYDTAYDEYNVSSTSGNIEIKNADGNSIKATSVSGKIDVDDSKTNSFVSKSTSGNISANDIALEICETSSVSGNCTFDFDKLDSIDFKGKTTSGNITLKFSNKLELDITSNKTVKTDYESNSNSPNKISLNTSSGTMKID